MEALLETILWRPGVGDPTFVGWVTTFGYGVAAALCARAGRHASANDECPMTNDEGDGKHRRLNIEQSTSNIGMGDEEWPREGAKDTKNFQIAKDAKDTNRVNMNEVPAGAPEGTSGAAVVPKLELNNERTGANDEGCGKHRTLNIQQQTSNIGTRNLECGTNNEGTKERRGSVEDRSQSSEVGNQRPKNRDQKSDVRGQKSEAEKDVRLWFVLAVGLLFLGINKQLDLQTLLIQIGRDVARAQGWYSSRRMIQMGAVIAAALAGSVWLFRFRETLLVFFKKKPLLLAGVSLLGAYLFLRIIAIDHVGEMLHLEIPDDSWWLTSLEISALGCISFKADRRNS